VSHQPFETWILSGEALNEEQKQALSEHLKLCEACNQLKLALNSCDSLFISSSNPLPRPGFTQRWQKRWDERRQQKHIQKIWLFTLGMLGLANLILFTWLFIRLPNFNWSYELNKLIANISTFTTQTRNIWTFASSATKSLPILLPMMIIIGFGCLLCITALIFLWYRYLNQRSITQQ
jgi:putative flippase GtrA